MIVPASFKKQRLVLKTSSFFENHSGILFSVRIFRNDRVSKNQSVRSYVTCADDLIPRFRYVSNQYISIYLFSYRISSFLIKNAKLSDKTHHCLQSADPSVCPQICKKPEGTESSVESRLPYTVCFANPFWFRSCPFSGAFFR